MALDPETEGLAAELAATTAHRPRSESRISSWPPGAHRLAADTLDAARHRGTPGAVGETLPGVARVDDAVEVLREAVDMPERSPARLVHAQALVDLGAALRRQGRRESPGPLRGAGSPGGCDAGSLVERARCELAASGVRVHRQARGAAGLLTVRERRIADSPSRASRTPRSPSRFSSRSRRTRCT